MHRIAFAALAVMVMATTAIAQSWQRFVDPAGVFAVEVPGTFSFFQDQMIAGMPGRAFSGRSGDFIYVIIAIDARTMPADAWAMGPDKVAEAVADGAIAGRTLVSRRSVPYPGGGAHEVISTEPDGMTLRYWFVVRRPYMMNVMVGHARGDRAALTGPEADRFLSSAKITGPAS